MIQSQSIHHVSISVTDLQKAKSFYKDVFGLEEIQRPNFDFPGAWFQIGSQQLHLIVHPNTRTLRGSNQVNSRDGHFAVRVKDYHETIRHLEKLRIPYKENPKSITGWPQIYCCDPDGNVIEMNVEPKGL
ncbi:VOC family protein [Paludifilum halophilum]|uniref:Glyoxalase n=1 Tax=Paludifilum halophilum TaxID=1642702 RepID=A0A235B846_9BACL|nr:VOC family protein [Paludifilum halophilum]OYD08456.1 glyoxalase [Paludifilum halophilum]